MPDTNIEITIKEKAFVILLSSAGSYFYSKAFQEKASVISNKRPDEVNFKFRCFLKVQIPFSCLNTGNDVYFVRKVVLSVQNRCYKQLLPT